MQHHHAHVASAAAEAGLTGEFIGVAFDGLGMGDDGTFWGGEVLVATLATYRRVARFGRAPMPGGALAVKKPYRMALGYLLAAEAFEPEGSAVADWIDPELTRAFLDRLDPREVEVVRVQLARGLNAPVASSAGRLFDAAASLLGIRDVAEYEAQAAIELELLAEEGTVRPLPYRDRPAATGSSSTTRGRRFGRCSRAAPPATPPERWPPVPGDDRRRHPRAVRRRSGRDTGLRAVALSGGVFQNQWLADYPRPAPDRRRLRGPHQSAGPGERRRDQLRSGSGGGRSSGRSVLAARSAASAAARRTRNVPRHPGQGGRDPRRRPAADGPRRLRRRAQGSLPGLRAGGRASATTSSSTSASRSATSTRRRRCSTLEMLRAIDAEGMAQELGAMADEAAGGRRRGARGASGRRSGGRMKYIDEYRDAELARKLVDEIHRVTTRPWTLMEVCGGQTHTLVKQGIDEALPDGRADDPRPRLPGLRHAARADRQGPGHRRPAGRHLHQLRRHAARARLDDGSAEPEGPRRRRADRLLAAGRGPDRGRQPDRQVVFFAIGFETTAPANAMAVRQAARLGLDNFSVLVSHVLVPPAMEAILESPTNQVQAFLAAGHVCAVMGWTEYEPIARALPRPDRGHRLRAARPAGGHPDGDPPARGGRAEVENQYARAVKREGNREAQETVFRVFEVGDRKWRGIGMIPASGYHLRPEFARFDAEARFDVGDDRTRPSIRPASPARSCRARRRRSTARPTACSARPQKPLGAPMVSRRGHVLGLPRRGAGTGRCRRRCRCTTLAAGAEPVSGRRPPDRSAPTDRPRLRRVNRRSGRAGPGDLVCPAPIPERARVLLGHGSGGQLSAALMRDVIGPALACGGARAARSTTRPWWRWPGSGSPSRPIRSSSARSSSPAATSASWRSTAPSTTWP